MLDYNLALDYNVASPSFLSLLLLQRDLHDLLHVVGLCLIVLALPLVQRLPQVWRQLQRGDTSPLIPHKQHWAVRVEAHLGEPWLLGDLLLANGLVPVHLLPLSLRDFVYRRVPRGLQL